MTRRTLIHIVIGAVGLAASMALFIGCNEPTSSIGTLAEWTETHEAAWTKVVACWQYEPKRPIVYERDDCYGEYPQRFMISQSTAAYGMFYRPNRVVLCPDAGAAKHEFSHMVRYAMTGDAGQNYSGECGL